MLLGLPLAGYVLGVSIILSLNYLMTGDALTWIKAQGQWGRHFAMPYTIFFNAKDQGVEMWMYAVWLFVGPITLAISVWQYYRNHARSSLDVHLLVLFYTAAILLPIWFGGAVGSLYRILYLVPFLLAQICQSPKLMNSRMFQALMWLLNIHATYRFAAGLHIA